ncbi:hypothetical protein IIU_06752, partial [Bacillus cereus VD133]
TSLTKPSGSDPLVEITVPKGSHAAYVTGENHSSELIIERGAGLEFTEKPTKVLDGNNYRIKIKARLLSSEEMGKRAEKLNEKVKDKESKLNNRLISKLKLDKSSNFIKLDFSGPQIEYNIKKTEEAINDFLSNVPSNLAKKCMEELETIKFTDQNLGIENDAGSYTANKNEIIVRTNHPGLVNSDSPLNTVSNVLLHEMGHAVGEAVTNHSDTSPQFKSIFQREKNNITDLITYKGYAQKNISEFYAEIFRAMYSPDSKMRKEIQKQAPEAVAYIKEKVDQFVKKS